MKSGAHIKGALHLALMQLIAYDKTDFGSIIGEFFTEWETVLEQLLLSAKIKIFL